MDIVVSHTNPDFDSLASQFAVSKLYPGSRMVPAHGLSGALREFVTLYRHWLPLAELRYIDADSINHLFIVDCQHIERLEEPLRLLISERATPYTVFDHHSRDEKGLSVQADSRSIIKPAGACTTLLVNELRARQVQLTRMEATLLATGIYEDSGSLTYEGTSADDAEAVAYLLRQGADLHQVAGFMNPRLSDEQTQLFQTLVANVATFEVGGRRMVVSTAQCDNYIDGLATLTRRLLEVMSGQVAVTVVKMRDRVYIVGRSDAYDIDMRALVKHWGGGGHRGAASAAVKGGALQSLQRDVVELLKQQAPAELQAAKLMKTPVRTVPSDTTMEEASRLMLRYDEDGLVVLDDGAVVGIVSRRDSDKALHHRLGHAPVKGFMTRDVISVAPESPLSEIHDKMVENDIGRLPVLDKTGQLVGVITRRELVRTMYGAQAIGVQATPTAETHPRHMQLNEKLEKLAPPVKWLFHAVGETALQLGMSAYVVGGCVRDLFLGSRTFDLDFVIEGSAQTVAGALESRWPGRFKLAAQHDRFQTATVDYFAEEKREVDLSTARIEFYEQPAALPTVEADVLERDLFRRDFTINALAVCLNPQRYGELVDFFDGVADIEKKLIRVLHNFSFIEDPTRIIRAARFSARLGFELEEETRQQAQRAIAMGVFDNLGGFRLKAELKLILESAQRRKALDILSELGGGLTYLAPELVFDQTVKMAMHRAQRLLSRNRLEEEWVVYLGTLLACLRGEQLESVISRLSLGNEEQSWLRSGLLLFDQLSAGETDRHAPRSKIADKLQGHALQALAIAASLARPGSRSRRWIKLYLDELRHIHTALGGDDLLALGFPQAPVLKEALKALRDARLDGVISDVVQEKDYLRQHYPQYVTGSPALRVEKRQAYRGGGD